MRRVEPSSRLGSLRRRLTPRGAYITICSFGRPEATLKTPLARPLLERLAARFKALAEPNRLAILSALVAGERTVTELVEETGLGQANVSKHLLLLHQQGFVGRRKEGLNVYYRLVDEDVFRICDLMCGRLEAEARGLSELLGGTGQSRTARARREA